MLPGAVVPLKHKFSWRIGRIQIDVGVEEVACGDAQRLPRPIEIMLMRSLRRRRLMRHRTGVGGRIAAHPCPGIATVRAGNRAGGHGIIHPNGAAAQSAAAGGTGRAVGNGIGNNIRGRIRNDVGRWRAAAANGREGSLTWIEIAAAGCVLQFDGAHHICCRRGPARIRITGASDQRTGDAREWTVIARPAVHMVARHRICGRSPTERCATAAGRRDQRRRWRHRMHA